MKTSGTMKPAIEMALPALLLLTVAVSGLFLHRQQAAAGKALASGDWKTPAHKKPVEPIDFQPLETTASGARERRKNETGSGLFVSELRVAAVGSAYPIPYDAAVCPYSEIPQPAMNQLDRDGDGITDDWELKFGLDKYNAADADLDPDGDGFTNLEEFRADSLPDRSRSHPLYATKLRFIAKKEKYFPLAFQGVTELPDGSFVFQINTPADGKTHFLGVGEKLQGAEIKEFKPGAEGGVPQLLVVRGNYEILLVRGEKTADPESEAELINLLDHSTKIATMGALLSLHSDEYTVLGVHQDRVVLRHLGTEEVFDIVGLAEGESKGFPEDL